MPYFSTPAITFDLSDSFHSTRELRDVAGEADRGNSNRGSANSTGEVAMAAADAIEGDSNDVVAGDNANDEGSMSKTGSKAAGVSREEEEKNC